MTPIPASDEWVVNVPIGTVVASEYCYYMKNRNYRADGTVPGFIYFSAYSAGAPYMVGAGFCNELARRGYPGICGDLGDTPTGLFKNDGPGSWGTDAARAKVDSYKAYLQGALGAKAGKVIVLYGSHGCSGAYSWAYANQSSVYCLAGVIGTCDVEDIRANNLGGGGGFQSSIESRYTNNAGWQAARATHNPVEVAGAISAAGIPQLDYYSVDDPICRLATHQALGTASAGHIEQHSLGSVGHSISTLYPRTGSQVQYFCDWVESKVAA